MLSRNYWYSPPCNSRENIPCIIAKLTFYNQIHNASFASTKKQWVNTVTVKLQVRVLACEIDDFGLFVGIYYCFTTVIVILSIFLSALVAKIGRSGEEGNRPPRIIKIVCLVIAVKSKNCTFHHSLNRKLLSIKSRDRVHGKSSTKYLSLLEKYLIGENKTKDAEILGGNIYPYLITIFIFV